MNETHLKQEIVNALAALAAGPLAPAAARLLRTLGYHSDRRQPIIPNTADGFRADWDPDGRLKPEKALTGHWRSVDLLFQLTGDDLGDTLQGSLDFGGGIDRERIQSYLFFAVDLHHPEGKPYTRTELAGITREVNKLFPMPAMLLFRHGGAITLALIHRRENLTDSSRDVLEKVTLIKDVRCAQPVRAHIEILSDLALPNLRRDHDIRTWTALHNAWRKTLDVSELNKRFYREVADWYFVARKEATFPQVDPPGANREEGNSLPIIRLLTRLIFVWFMKEKGLVPEDLFDERRLPDILRDFAPDAPTYYQAVLQNLFFATLNSPRDVRGFRAKTGGPHRQRGDYMMPGKYHYEDLFRDPEAAKALFGQVPFVNGGLFDCLDDEKTEERPEVRLDGFSDEESKSAILANRLFFDDQGRECDLEGVYGGAHKAKVRGLVDIFRGYKFTVAENTPVEEEIALDPELLGRVFENLLGSVNPETRTTARKLSGSFYTPREIVNYMVDEALMAVLGEATGLEEAEARRRMEDLFAYSEEPLALPEADRRALIAAIDKLKVLDPACGSGAFPMGVLHRLVHLLSRLDPHNALWKQRQIDRAGDIEDHVARENAVRRIEELFPKNELGYGRKLYLIEHAIYGVDIQPIAIQIAKLRFFLSLLIDQKNDDAAENRGVDPLPNLETNLVIANSLLGVQPVQAALPSPELLDVKAARAKVRDRLFTASRREQKKALRDQDRALRKKMQALLAGEFAPEDAARMARWDPFDTTRAAEFFDPEWMFPGTGSFHIVIANPPFVRQERIKEEKPALKAAFPDLFCATADLYTYFYGRAVELLRPGGMLAFISSNKWFRAAYGEKLRSYVHAWCSVRSIVDFGELPVFEAATFPMIFLARKRPKKLVAAVGKERVCFTQVKSLDPPYPDVAALIRESGRLLPANAIQGAKWTLAEDATAERLRRMERAGVPLGDYAKGRLFRGLITGLNKAFVIDAAKREELIAEDPRSAEIIKPLAVGDDVRRWRIRDKGRWLIVTRIGVDMDRYPEIMRHLMQWQQALEKRQDQGEHWWELRACAYYDAFAQPKIVFPDIAKEPRFTLDTEGTFVTNTTYFVPWENLYLLGVLNSQTVWKYCQERMSVLGDPAQGGRLRFFTQFVAQLPIPDATPEEQAPVVALVERVLAAKRADAGADVSALEGEIDGLVAGLYGV